MAKSRSVFQVFFLCGVIAVLTFVFVVPLHAHAAFAKETFFERVAQRFFCSVVMLWDPTICAVHAAQSDPLQLQGRPDPTLYQAAVLAALDASEQEPEPTTIIQNITNPVIDRIVKTNTVVYESGITEDQLNIALNELRKDLYASANSALATLPNSFGSAVAPSASVWGLTQRIDTLDGATITNATVSGGTISDVNLSGSSLTFSGGAIDNTPIGATTPSSGAFTTLSVAGATTLSSTLAVTGATTLATTTLTRLTIS